MAMNEKACANKLVYHFMGKKQNKNKNRKNKNMREREKFKGVNRQ